MKTKVKVTADEAGNVIIKSSNNPEYGHIRVEQTRISIDDSGFARKRKLSALIPGTVEDLKVFGWSAEEEVLGAIIVKESQTPFNAKFPENDLKIAGKSGIICGKGGSPIYRKSFYTMNENAVDSETIPHDNSQEIEEAYAAIGADGNKEEQEFKI